MARTAPFKLVLDTNVLVRGLAGRASDSGRLLRLCEAREVVMLLSQQVLAEYRDVLSRDELTHRHPALTAEAVALVIERLRYVAELIDPVRARFRYDRDPDDECFIELAISGAATHVVTYDADLLSLSAGRSDETKRLRQRARPLKVVDPGAFLHEYQARGGS